MFDLKLERLDKLVTLAGVSRSDARKYIQSGRVSVLGQVVRDIAFKAQACDVSVDGEQLEESGEIYLMINKPAGVVTATEDRHLQTVVDLLPEKYQRRKLGPVGRLDRDVTGLVLLTTDGEMAHRLISPKWKAEKQYRAICEGCLCDADVQAFAEGLELSDFVAQPSRLIPLEVNDERSMADVILTEGKFHQVKRMLAYCGKPVVYLKRLSMGPLRLDERLKIGEFRLLTAEEEKQLKDRQNAQERKGK